MAKKYYSLQTELSNREWVNNIAMSAESLARPNYEIMVSDKDVINSVIEIAKLHATELVQDIVNLKIKMKMEEPKEVVKKGRGRPKKGGDIDGKERQTEGSKE